MKNMKIKKIISILMVLTIMIGILSISGFAADSSSMSIDSISDFDNQISPNSTVVGISYFFEETSSKIKYGSAQDASDVGSPGGTIWATRSLSTSASFSVSLTREAKLAVLNGMTINCDLTLSNDLSEGSGYSYHVKDGEYARIVWSPKLCVSTGVLTTIITYSTGSETITQNITVTAPVERRSGIADGLYGYVTGSNPLDV